MISLWKKFGTILALVCVTAAAFLLTLSFNGLGLVIALSLLWAAVAFKLSRRAQSRRAPDQTTPIQKTIEAVIVSIGAAAGSLLLSAAFSGLGMALTFALLCGVVICIL